MRKNALREVPSVTAQIDAQIGILRKKWPDFRCVAYFQNFTNTYAPVALLKERFEEALRHPLCTDSLSLPGLTALARMSKTIWPICTTERFLWVELGLQTSDEISAQRIRRGYPFSVYKEAVNRLTARGIRVVTHLIAGLPGEDRENFLHSVRRTVSDDIFGVKLQLLHIMKNTELGRLWQVQQAASSPDGSVLGTQRGQGKAFPGAGLPENTSANPLPFPESGLWARKNISPGSPTPSKSFRRRLRSIVSPETRQRTLCWLLCGSGTKKRFSTASTWN